MKPIYTLHKLPQGYVLTSDEEIKERFEGYLLDDEGFIRHGMSDIKALLSFNGKKVIAQNFDFFSLSPEEQKEIGWFDWREHIGDLAIEDAQNAGKLNSNWNNAQWTIAFTSGFEQGFQKAQELLGGFTLDDIRNALSESFKASQEGYSVSSDEIIKSLFQPKSWEVEVEMETLYLEEDSMNYTHEQDDVSGSKDFPKLTNGKIKILRLIK